MEASLVHSGKILAFTFNFERSSVIFLKQPNHLGENPFNELIEMDLNSQTILEKLNLKLNNARYLVSSQLPSQPPFSLVISRRKGYLILSFQPSNMEIWKLGQGKGGINQSIWVGETKGKRGYEIQATDVSNLDGTLFFSAVGQRNVYCANADDSILNNSSSLNISKLKLPPKVTVHDIRSHPTDYRVLAACSDGSVRIWNYNTFTELIGLTDIEGSSTYAVTALSFQADGQKLIVGTESGALYCWDGKTLGSRNILLAVHKIQDSSNILSLHWLNYNGSPHNEDFVCYTIDGNVKLMRVKLDVPQAMIRDQKMNKSKKQELFGRIVELHSLTTMKNDINTLNFKQYNIGINRFLGAHPYANFVCINSVKFKVDNVQQNSSSSNPNNISFLFQTSILLLNDKFQVRVEYPVCSPQYHYNFRGLIPDANKRIFCQRYIFFIDNQEIKYYCISKGILRTLVNLKNLIMHDEIQYNDLDFRPKSIEYSQTVQFLVTYKVQNTFVRCLSAHVDIDDGNVADNFRELPCSKAFYLGNQEWINPPLYLLHEDRQSYSLIFDDLLPKDMNMLKNLHDQELEKLQTCMKQPLNLRVERMFSTPIRHGFVVIYQSENLLRFSRNRIQENQITDFLMLNANDMQFKLNYNDTITDVVWQRDESQLMSHTAAIICIDRLYLVDNLLKTLKVISMLPHINQNNLILSCQWLAYTLIIQTKFHLLYMMFNGKNGSIMSIDTYESKNILAGILWDRIIFLSQSQQNKRGNPIEIKTKSINLLQPIIAGYLHHQDFFKLDIDHDVVRKTLQTFKTNCVDKTLIQDLVKLNLYDCAEFILNHDDAKQFTSQDKLEFYIKQLDSDKVLESLLANGSLYTEDDQNQLLKRYNDPRGRALQKQLNMAQRYFQLSRAPKTTAILGSYSKENSLQSLPINILSSQNRLQSLQDIEIQGQYQQVFKQISQYTVKPNNNLSREQMNLNIANCVKSSGSEQQSIYKQNLSSLLQVLEQQKEFLKSHSKEIENGNFAEFKPSHFFTDELIQKLNLIKKKQKLETGLLNFGEAPFNLVYWDKPSEDDEEEDILKNNGMMIRQFDQLSFDSIYFYLGVGGQPVAKAVTKFAIGENKMQEELNQEENDFGQDDDDAKEFQDLVIYWRVDEGKGTIFEDLGNYQCQGDIIVNSEPHQEEVWINLEESDPMELEDKWGKKCPPQFAVNLNNQICVQSHKKNWWKKKLMNCFTLEIWVKPSENGFGQLLAVGESDLVMLVDQNYNIVVNVQNNKIKFEINKDDNNQDDQQNIKIEPNLKVSKWNHICLSYEKDRGQLCLYLNAKDSFISQDIELSANIFRDKFLYLGKNGQSQQQSFQGYITEFRMWKQGFSINEIKDGFKTPLAIVAEKKKSFRMKFKEKKDNTDKKSQNFSEQKFPGFLQLDNPFQIKAESNKEIIIQEDKKIQVEDIISPLSAISLQPSTLETFNSNNFGSFNQPDKQFMDGNFDNNNFESGFGNAEQWDVNFSYKTQDFVNDTSSWQDQTKFDDKINQQVQQQAQESSTKSEDLNSKKKDAQPIEQVKQPNNSAQSQNITTLQPPQTTQQVQPNIGSQIQKLMDEATEDFTKQSIVHGIESINKALELLQKYIEGANKERLKKVQKFIIYCATYRFSFQLLIGIKQMKDQSNPRKEVFLYLVLIHLNLKPQHRITLIIKTINDCLLYSNNALAEALYQSLLPNLEKTKPSETDSIMLSDCKGQLGKLKDKLNANLLKMTCPYCLKHFHFKGLKKCSKCSKEFLLCCQTLSCVRKDLSLKCLACESVFGLQAKKANDQCPICKLDKLFLQNQ